MDNLDFRKVIYIYLQYKTYWFISVFISVGLSLTIAMNITQSYRVTATIIPMSELSNTNSAPSIGAILPGMSSSSSNAVLDIKARAYSYKLYDQLAENLELRELIIPGSSDSLTAKERFSYVNELQGSVYLESKPQSPVMTIISIHNNPKVSFLLNRAYLEILENSIYYNLKERSKNQIEFLELKLRTAEAPQFRTEIAKMLSDKVKEMMLVNQRAFELIDPPVVPVIPFKPSKAMVAIGVFLFTTLLTMFLFHIYLFILDLKSYQHEK